MPKFKACSSAHTIRKRYVWMQIFLNTKEKPSIFENTRLRVDGEIRFKNPTCGRRLFLNTEGKNLHFRKYPATCGRGLNCVYKSLAKEIRFNLELFSISYGFSSPKKWKSYWLDPVWNIRSNKILPNNPIENCWNVFKTMLLYLTV